MITCTLVHNSFCLLKDCTFLLFLVCIRNFGLYWIIPINKHDLMSWISKTNKNSSTSHFLSASFFTVINSETPQKRFLDMLTPILLPHSVSNPLRSYFLLTIPLKLLLTCSSMITMMLNPMANYWSSSYLTYIGDHMSQFSQESLSFACCLHMIINSILFHLKNVPFWTSYMITQHYLFDTVAHFAFLETLSSLGS